MGVVNNEAVLATTWNKGVVTEVDKWISGLTKDKRGLFAKIPSLVNGDVTIVFGPDGSKKGWPLSNEIEHLRGAFIALLESFNYEDGSSPVAWVEVGYGEFGQKVLRGNNANRYDDSEYAGA